MPDFDARIVGGAETTWVDAPSASPQAPTRLNYDPAYLPTYRRVLIAGTGTTIEVRATVAGVETPLDAALGGRLFVGAWAEWSGVWPPNFVSPGGQSSLVYITLYAASHVGHFLFRLRRPGGGAILIPFDVETP